MNTIDGVDMNHGYESSMRIANMGCDSMIRIIQAMFSRGTRVSLGYDNVPLRCDNKSDVVG
jgi:hypothetical protein